MSGNAARTIPTIARASPITAIHAGMDTAGSGERTYQRSKPQIPTLRSEKSSSPPLATPRRSHVVGHEDHVVAIMAEQQDIQSPAIGIVRKPRDAIAFDPGAMADIKAHQPAAGFARLWSFDIKFGHPRSPHP